MSPARDQVRERGTWTWTIWAALLALVTTVALSSMGGTISATLAAEMQPAAAKKKATKKKVKKVKDLVEPEAGPGDQKDPADLSVEDIIRSEWGDRADDALRVANCESRLDPGARSRKGAVGVFQIMPGFHSWRVDQVEGGTDLWDPLTNVRVAKDLFDDEGWRPWVCARILGVRA